MSFFDILISSDLFHESLSLPWQGTIVNVIQLLGSRINLHPHLHFLLTEGGVAARVLSAVAEEKINVEIISFGTSEVAYYFIVLENDLEKAIKAINREFFEKVQ